MAHPGLSTQADVGAWDASFAPGVNELIADFEYQLYTEVFSKIFAAEHGRRSWILTLLI